MTIPESPRETSVLRGRVVRAASTFVCPLPSDWYSKNRFPGYCSTAQHIFPYFQELGGQHPRGSSRASEQYVIFLGFRKGERLLDG